MRMKEKSEMQKERERERYVNRVEGNIWRLVIERERGNS